VVKIVTLGAYGFTEQSFRSALIRSEADTFCDLRARRGMRGSRYAFANKARLEQMLRELGIRYLHIPALAPSEQTRELQRREDEKEGIAKRVREILSPAFIAAYDAERLKEFDSRKFLSEIGAGAHKVILFCVEKQPQACHRSLVAKRLHTDLAIEVEDIVP